MHFLQRTKSLEFTCGQQTILQNVVMGLILLDGVIALDQTELHYSGYGVCRPHEKYG
jgi:hypothetical protein